MLESTPSVKGKSAVESGLLQSTNHRYHVPCPHCYKFQTLEFGDGKAPGGIFFDRLPSGQSDADLARKTAHYVCRWCEGRIDDMQRPWM
ncbi:MAG: phage terminase large subunit family protein, partial [Planctomyces sp.]